MFKGEIPTVTVDRYNAGKGDQVYRITGDSRPGCLVRREEVYEELEKRGGTVERLVDASGRPIRYLTYDQLVDRGWIKE